MGHEISFLDENWEKGLSWYLSKMPIAEPDQLTVDFTPKYLFSEEAPERAHQVLPQAKLLLVVRDPIDRLVSDFHHLNASSQIESLEEFANSNQEVMKFGYYADHIKNWLRFYPKEQLYIVNGNDLMTEPARELAKIETFWALSMKLLIMTLSSTITSTSSVKLPSTKIKKNVNIAVLNKRIHIKMRRFIHI